MLNFDDKVALVTGCGSHGEGWGNGKAIAVLLARRGAQVYGLDCDLSAAEETRRIVEAEGGRLASDRCDVTKTEEVVRAVTGCIARFGRIDVLVNNVGVSAPGGVVDMDERTWDAQFEINLKSVFRLCKAVVPVMQAQGGGSIVNIASIAGLRHTGKDQIAYASSKAALIQFTRMTAVAHGANGIRANCVVPGLITTPLVQRLADQFAGGDLDAYVRKRNAQVPLTRGGTAWDVANAAVFLASDEAQYITATELVVDGGVTATMPR